MGAFLEGVQSRATAIVILAALAILLVLIIHWLAWLFGWGRFSAEETKKRAVPRREKAQSLRYLITEGIVRIINDFRHLLALLFLLFFGFTLIYVLAHATSAAEMKEGLLAVTSTIGVVLASIIGYYFGEARGAGAPNATLPNATEAPVIQQQPPAPGSSAPRMEPAPSPQTEEDDPSSDEDADEEAEPPGGP